MSKKNDQFYFDNFIECADCALRAAQKLEESLEHYNYSKLSAHIDEIHEIEHEGDSKRHAMMAALAKSFVTPIEREDIMSLSNNIDDAVDTIEDVLLRIYINDVHQIRPEAVNFTKKIIRCCVVMKQIMTEFADFKKSKKLNELIIEINALEEDCDRLFIDSMHSLHNTCRDAIEIIAWREIFIYLEKCADACENVADIVESVIMKNK